MNSPLYAMDQPTSESTMPSVGFTSEQKIPQPGSRPLVFKGVELAMAMSFTPGLPYWYEINIYRTDAQDFVVAIRLFYQAADEDDRVKAWVFPTLDEAMDHIQTYDAGLDIHVPDMVLDKMVPAEMTALALSMKSEVTAIRHHYAGLVGELFMEIESADPSFS